MKPKNIFIAIIIFASLAANLVLGGILLGEQAGRKQFTDYGALKPLLALEHKLPPEQAQKLDALLAPEKDGLLQTHAKLRQQRLHIRELLTAPQLNEAELVKAYSDYREMMQNYQQRVQALTTQIALALPQEQRRELLDERWK